MWKALLTIVIVLAMVLLVGRTCRAQPDEVSVGAVIEETAVLDLALYPWVYLREGQPLIEDEQLISVIAVGDMLLGRGIAEESDPLSAAAGWLGAADVTLGNLEGVLAVGGSPRAAPSGEAQPIILQGAPEAAVLLAQGGFDILGQANNHSLDFGAAGLQESSGHLQQAGLQVMGVVNDEGQVQPVVIERDGLRLAFLAFNAVPDPHPAAGCPSAETCWPQPLSWDPLSSPALITAAKAQADALIVSVHWGYEYQPQPEPFQETAVQAMFEAGADVVAGHHAHVPQRVTVVGDRVAAYSLGNFLFDQGQDETGHGLALRAFFDGQGLRAVQVLPIQAGTKPRLAGMEEARPWLAALLPDGPRLAFACSDEVCTAIPGATGRQDGRFFAGLIDLTGDGRPETVRRAGERITIFEGGDAVWSSPEEWRVVDVALGDPNDDGRYEIMLAIWQEDAGGYERSQPYIVGYRGGRYDLLWGGRPVADPILELAVGDVDGDGTDELIVIEELAGGSETAVSVWRWAGWTFSKVWRSELGHYSDLVLVQDGGTVITVDPGQSGYN